MLRMLAAGHYIYACLPVARPGFVRTEGPNARTVIILSWRNSKPDALSLRVNSGLLRVGWVEVRGVRTQIPFGSGRAPLRVSTCDNMCVSAAYHDIANELATAENR